MLLIQISNFQTVNEPLNTFFEKFIIKRQRKQKN